MLPAPRWLAAARLTDFGPTRRLALDLEGTPLLLVQSGKDVLAVQNRCTHLGHPLHEGRVMAGQITCPFHGACFDLRTGTAVSGPAVAPLVRFETRVTDGQVEVRLP